MKTVFDLEKLESKKFDITYKIIFALTMLSMSLHFLETPFANLITALILLIFVGIDILMLLVFFNKNNKKMFWLNYILIMILSTLIGGNLYVFFTS